MADLSPSIPPSDQVSSDTTSPSDQFSTLYAVPDKRRRAPPATAPKPSRDRISSQATSTSVDTDTSEYYAIKCSQLAMWLMCEQGKLSNCSGICFVRLYIEVYHKNMLDNLILWD